MIGLNFRKFWNHCYDNISIKIKGSLHENMKRNYFNVVFSCQFICHIMENSKQNQTIIPYYSVALEKGNHFIVKLSEKHKTKAGLKTKQNLI